MKTLGFLGKPDINEQETALLHQLGRVIARSGRELLIAPAPGSVTTVEMGVNAEEGRVRHIATGVLTASAHSLVYADERLLTKIVTAYPAFKEMKNVHLMSSTLEIELFLQQARVLFRRLGVEYPE